MVLSTRMMRDVIVRNLPRQASGNISVTPSIAMRDTRKYFTLSLMRFHFRGGGVLMFWVEKVVFINHSFLRKRRRGRSSLMILMAL